VWTSAIAGRATAFLDEVVEILLEQKVATTPEAMQQIFEKIPRGLMPWRPEHILLG
jgi:hypothetical protein